MFGKKEEKKEGALELDCLAWPYHLLVDKILGKLFYLCPFPYL